MIIKHKGKRYDDQVGSGKLREKLKSRFKTIRNRFSKTTLGTNIADASTQIGSDWGTKGKARTVGKLAGATLMLPVAAIAAGISGTYKGLTSSLPGAIKYGYHGILRNIQKGKLANTERKIAAYQKFDELKSPQNFNPQKKLNDSLEKKDNFSRVLGKYFGLGLSRENKLLRREAQRKKTLNSLTKQGQSAKTRVAALATEIGKLNGSNQQTPAKPNKKVLKQLKSLEKQKAILNSEIAFTESEKARKKEKYETRNTRKREKLQNQLERRQTRIKRTNELLKENVKQIKSVYKAPKTVFSALVKSAYSPSKASEEYNKMRNKLKKSGGLGRTLKGKESVARAFTPNEDIKTTTDGKLYNTFNKIDELQKELGNSGTSTKRKLEIQKQMKPLKSEAYKLSQIQSKLAHYYNRKSAKEQIEINRLNALRNRYNLLSNSKNGEKYKTKIDDIDENIRKKTENKEAYSKHTTQYKYNKNPETTRLIFDGNQGWYNEVSIKNATITGIDQYNNPIYSYTEPDGTIVRYSTITNQSGDRFTYYKDTIQPTIQKIRPEPVNLQN